MITIQKTLSMIIVGVGCQGAVAQGDEAEFGSSNDAVIQKLSPFDYPVGENSLHAIALDQKVSPQARRTYNNPRFRGYRIDRCLILGQRCGAPVAHQICVDRGYRRAIGFSVEQTTPTITLGSWEICRSPSRRCDAFSTVECER